MIVIMSVVASPPCVPWPGEGCELLKNATTSETVWLRNNMFHFDAPNVATLFDGGIAVPTVELALGVRMRFGWAASVPRSIFRSSVLPYANVNEARTDWRQLMTNTLTPVLAAVPNSTSLADVATLVNGKLWPALGGLTGRKTIVFQGDQTPLVFDSLSTILFGSASCTGISITLVDALRAAGVPARLVGTPAWHAKPSDGNHNWVEAWLGRDKGWRFIEGIPAGGGETFDNPCDKWFCDAQHFNGSGTQVFAATYGYGGSPGGGTHYPMAWDLKNLGVPGVDRSGYYDKTCSAC
jgi:hypothetical protein